MAQVKNIKQQKRGKISKRRQDEKKEAEVDNKRCR